MQRRTNNQNHLISNRLWRSDESSLVRTLPVLYARLAERADGAARACPLTPSVPTEPREPVL
jgi:hypothetical protein